VASQCTDPFLFGALSRLPGGRIGESHYEPEFGFEPAAASVDAMSGGLAVEVHRQLEIRTRIAGFWRAGLTGLGGVTLPEPAAGTRAAFLRVPMLVADQARRKAVNARLAEARFGYVTSYPGTLATIAPFRALCSAGTTPGADEIAARVIALPCHAGIREEDVARAVRS
jgi:dTDP-4-amino-4,6-dideoxygalactose transaminase